MAKKTIKISEEAHSALKDYKDENGHTSFDSAIREVVERPDIDLGVVLSSTQYKDGSFSLEASGGTVEFKFMDETMQHATADMLMEGIDQ